MEYEKDPYSQQEQRKISEAEQRAIIDIPRSDYVENNQQKKPKRRMKNITLIVIILISALMGGVISSYAMPVYVFGKLIPYPKNYFGQDIKQIINVKPQNTEFLVSAVAKKAMPSVVGITTKSIQTDFFFGKQTSKGLGTGVIVDKRGYILTNAHVVNNGDVEELNVLFDDGTKKDAKILWNDPALDLAIIQVDGVNVIPADLGNSDNLEVGEVAIAIGNPLGMEFQKTVTSGIVSGLERSVAVNQNETIEDLIQTDASINPGNSGGPLLNAKGEVIGINTAKIQSGEGLGFAIPINIAKPIVDQFIEKGEFRKVYMGIKGMDVNVFERYTGIDLSADKGIYVAEVSKNSPAAKANLRTGDIIIGVDNKEITSMTQLIRALYKYRPEDDLTIKILRNEEEKTLKMKLQKIPQK
ncbi:serine protease HtrA [Marinisporobacter balticus]|uniref:S1-C subfamily serine protease n=1 Tax=Marinisporobacter balticus TaxID=2018667 RepID=A0A4R2LH89_9FIRM|nr:trypsin-like peptidase domain-containing protein [Marinisporobacter balticus]TCO78695.1 S1-C subfamily serine protease [Marinisporobacter balticus]